MKFRFALVTRVVVAFGVVVIALGASLLTHLDAQASLQAHFTLVTGGYLPVTRGLDEMGRELRGLQTLTADPDPEVVRRGLGPGRTGDTIARQLPSGVAGLRTHVDEILAADIPDSERSFLRNLSEVLPQLDTESRRILDLVRALEDAQAEDFAATRSTLRARLRRLERRTHDLGRVVEARLDALSGATEEIARRARLRILMGGAAALLVALAALGFLVRGLRPIAQLTRAVVGLRKGEFSGEAPIAAGDDEVALLVREFGAMAEALRDRDAELRHRTAALEEALAERLQAERALVEAERLAALGEMSSRITHEIRNPLSSISLNVEMLRDELDRLPDVDPEVREMFASIEREVARLTALTGDYLSAARAGEVTLLPLDLVPLVRDVLRQLEPRLHREAIAISCELPERAPCHGDENQLRQVLWNLLQNAAEALEEQRLPAAERRIRVRLERPDEGGALLHVEDSGAGWPAELDGRIFEPFFSTRAQGTGLGLGISRDVVKAHGGSIQAHRQGPLGGAQVSIRLPAAPSAEATPTGQSPG